MAVTHYSANRVIDRLFGSTVFTPPAQMFFGLSTTPINIDGTGATEPSGGGYGRVGMTNDKATWGVSSNGVLTNLLPVQFAESTALWGTITYVLIADALSGGNIWFFDVLTPSRQVQSATTVYFAAGAIQVTMNNS